MFVLKVMLNIEEVYFVFWITALTWFIHKSE